MSKRTQPHLVTAALLIGTFLSALDMNVVGTALPTMVGQLGGLELYGMVIGAYLLTSTTTQLIYGKLADLYGRKPIYVAATGLFLAGSMLCGAAGSMTALVFFRALQGLGAGGLLPITITLLGDLFSANKRAFIQGLFSTVWGVSSVLGPLIGGFLVTFVSWRWIFWLNLPIGLFSILILAFTLREQHLATRPAPRLDLQGAGLLMGSLVSLLLGLQGIKESGASGSSNAALLVLALLLGAVFIIWERRAPQPVLPLEMFFNRSLLVTTISGLALGAVLLSVVAYVPMYVQGVLHGSPTRAGLSLVPLSVFWTLMTFLSGPLARRLGYRPVVILGTMLCFVGAALVLRFGDGAMTRMYAPTITIGAGMGLSITSTMIAVQDETPWGKRGVATAMMTFSRTIGGMITVTILGVLITSRFIAQIAPYLPAQIKPEELLDPARWSILPPRVLVLAQAALDNAIGTYFWAVAVLGLWAFLVMFAFPKLRMERNLHTG